MTEKVFLPFYSGVSALIYFAVMFLIFAVPVLFITQAKASPDFRLDSVEVSPADGTDAFFTSSGKSADGWYKIVYHMNVGSKKSSPYSYTVEDFALKDPEDFIKTGNYAVFLDEPLSFSSTQRDDFVLTLYAGGFADETAAKEFAGKAAFGTRGISRNFSFFKERIMVYVPGFAVGDL